jgi:hypothetical protein
VSFRLAAVSLVVMVVALSAVGSASAAVAPSSTPKSCMGVGKGAHWSYKGQTGTAYTVLGVNGASCTLGLKWLQRLTRTHGYMTKGPTGWSCIVTAAVGECTIKNGGIFEWLPKLKK